MPSAASADVGDGIVTVRVVQEVNANGVVDDRLIEPPLAGVTVHLTDADGNTAAADTDGDGVATFDLSGLSGGQYRVDVDNPRPGTYLPGHAANDQSAFHVSDSSLPIDFTDADNVKLSSTTEFVDVREGQDAYVNVSFWYPPYYCQENATVCGASLPNSTPGFESQQTDETIASFNYQMDGSETTMATVADTGALYGFGWNSETRRLFTSAVAHRAAEYGPGGPGAIYVTSPGGGDTTLWASVPNVAADSHTMSDHGDYGFFDQVGKTSLGELEITNDNKYLFVTNLDDQSVYVYDAMAADGENALLGRYEIPNPCSVSADWRPFGAGVGLDVDYVGGVCSAESTQNPDDLRAVIYQFDPASGFGDVVLDQSLAYQRGLTFPDGTVCRGSLKTDPNVGRWFPWITDFPSGPNLATDNANGCFGWTGYPTPMLGDIIEDTNGDLIVSFRDRFTDQAGHNAEFPNAAGTGYSTNAQPATGGDILRGCRLTDGSFVLDPNFDPSTMTLASGSVCTDNNADTSINNHGQSRTFREYYSGDWHNGSHQESFYSGMALSRGEGTIASDVLDPQSLWSVGVGSINRDGSRNAGGINFNPASAHFGKGGGMADLEVLCDQAPIQIGNRVWSDANGNGIQDAGEVPIAGVTVNLYNDDGEVVGTTTTDANGNYFFDETNVYEPGAVGEPELLTGLDQNTDYIVAVDNPDDYAPEGPLEGRVPTQANAGDDDEHDSDGVTPDGGDYPQAAVTTGDAGVDDHSFDFGFTAPVSIGDYLWIDADGDGIQDIDEPPVPGTTVALVDENGDTVATTTTDENGFYAFTDLPPDTDYTVQFPTTITVDDLTYYLTTPEQGGDSAADSNPDPSTGNAPVTTPPSGNNSGEPGETDDPTIDAGYLPPVSIGDHVWLDENSDGVQDDGEAPVPGVEVTLVDENGDTVATTTTDENGYYAFTDLPPDTDYTVQFPTTVTVDGTDHVLTPAGQGDDETTDSNPNPLTGEAPVTTPHTGSNSGEPGEADNPTIDAGYTPQPEPVSIGDYVWIDADGDGVQDAGEGPVPGATVTLLDSDGQVVATTTTDDDGYYSFTDLPGDTDFTVEFPTEVTVDGIDYELTAPARGSDSAADSNPDQSTGQATVTTPAAGNNLGSPGDADDPTIDAGYSPKPVSIGDYVWLDADGDGVQDTGESPVPGATVALLDADGKVVATATTDEDGYYSFTDLPPNTDFTVQFPTTVTVDGQTYQLTEPDAGDDRSVDSNANPETGNAPVTTPKSGANSGRPGQADDPTIDAGYVPVPVPPVDDSTLVSIGDYVWLDADGDGTQDDDEPPVPGVTVTLLDADGNVVATTTTDDSGFYAFTDLRPNTRYGVQFPTTVTVDGIDYPLIEPGQGGDAALDSNADQSSGIAWVTTPSSGHNSAEPGRADNPTIDAGYGSVDAAGTNALSETGIDAGGMLTGALLLLVTGAVLLLAGQRRSRHAL